MANYIITKNRKFFDNIGDYNFCELEVLKDLPETIGFDSETTGLSALTNDMFCVQIGTGRDNYIVHMYDDNYTFYDVIPYLGDKYFIMQNGLFDLGFMYKYNFIPKRVGDTMIASKILHNGDVLNRRNDFGTLMKRELGITYDKTDQKNINVVKLSQPSAIKYSFNDVDRIIELHEVLLKKIKRKGFIKTYELHCRFIKALAYMEQCGLPISPKAWSDKMEVDLDNTFKYKKEVVEYIYDNVPKFADGQVDMFNNDKKIHVNLKSPQQMVPVFNSLGIKTKDKDGKDSIKENIIIKTKHEFIDLWLKYQGAQHRVSTFGASVYNKIINNRIYTNFNPMVDTARLSSRRGHINFLNFPSDKATRNCFEAKEENRMIVCDWGGQETVISADLSGDAAMTKSVVEGADLHCLLTRELFPEIAHLDDQDIMDNHSDKRKQAKAPRFAMQYGGNAYTLHVNENIPLKEADIIYDKFISLHQGLFDWGDKMFQISVKSGYIESVDGWRLKLPKYEWYCDLKKDIENISKSEWTLYRLGKAERQREYMIGDANAKRKKGTPAKEFIILNEPAYKYYRRMRKPISDFFSLQSEYKRLCLNNPVQTRGAHQMKLALCMMFEWIIENNLMWVVLMCNAVHDETVVECPKDLAEKVRDAVQTIMREAGDFYLETLKIKADAAIGQTWYEAK